MAGGSRKKPNRRPPSRAAWPAGRPKPPTTGATATPRKTQAERIDEARRARARKSRNTRLALAGAVLVLVGLVAFIVVDNNRDAEALQERLEAAGCQFDTRSDPTSSGAAEHVPPSGYEVDPPAGGNHDPSAAGAGVYTTENRPPDQRIVHSLQHGYVAIWHQPGLDEAGTAAVTEAIRGYERDVLVVPHASLTVPVAATAWGERLLCPTVAGGSLRQFVEAYRNKGPERVEHPPL